MDMENVIVEKPKFKDRMKDLGTRMRWRTKALMDWISENKELVVTSVSLFGAVGTGAIKVAKASSAAKRLRRERDLKERYIYDRSAGHYWKIRKKLSSDQWRVIEHRKRNGERYGDILEDMNLLD